MNEFIKDNSNHLKSGLDECCLIAESMMKEINQIRFPENAALSFVDGNVVHKASLKWRILKWLLAGLCDWVSASQEVLSSLFSAISYLI